MTTRFSRSLKSQFIVYALGSTLVPLLVIGVVLLFYSINMFTTTLEKQVRKSHLIFNQLLANEEKSLKNKVQVTAAFLSSGRQVSTAFLDTFLERTPYQIFEFFAADKPLFQKKSAALAANIIGYDLYLSRESARLFWGRMRSLLFSTDDVLTAKKISGKSLLLRAGSVVTDGTVKKGMVVESVLIDDSFCGQLYRQSGAQLIIYSGGRPLISNLFSTETHNARNDLADYESLAKRLERVPLLLEQRSILGVEYTVGFFPVVSGKRVIAVGAVAHNQVQLRSSIVAAVLLLLVFLAMSVVIIFFLGVYFSRKILHPVFELVQATEKMASGDLDVRITHRPENELGKLVDSFNIMAVAVYSQRQFMDNYNEILQNEIESRTEELKVAQDAIIHSEKMASLGQLTAGIAHEIKNPLNFIINFSKNNVDFIAKIEDVLTGLKGTLHKEQSDKVDRLFGILRSNSEDITEESAKIATIIQGMLNQARGDTNQKELYPVNRLVSESMNLLYHSLRASRPDLFIKMEKELDESLEPIPLNSSQINRVLVNVLDNAAFAVATRQEQGEEGYVPEVRVRTFRRRGYQVIEIRDNGPGIPDHIRNQIFEPFFTTKPTNKGTGLGLKISYDIIKDGHGGRIEVESVAGESTTFLISLPEEIAP